MADYKKDKLGYEDISMDSAGTEQTFSRLKSDGTPQNIKKLNAKLIPILLALRTASLYDTDTMAGATNINDALVNLAASLANVHKFLNESILDQIESAGSGAIISVNERAKLNSITNIGSGKIITDAERSKLSRLTNLTDEQLETLSKLNELLDDLDERFDDLDERLNNFNKTNVAYISEVQAYNTVADTASAGDNVRTLNTLSDPDNIVTSLSGNQFILPAGNYEITVETVLYRVDRSFHFLYNVTDSAIAIQSLTVYPKLDYDVHSYATFNGNLKLTAPKTFELHSYIGTASGVDNLGAAHNVSGYSNIYSRIKIAKKVS